MKAGIEIISYDEHYENDVKYIFNETAFMGDNIELFFDNRKFLADVATVYYLHYEKTSTFLALCNDNRKIVGYIMGCTDTQRYQRIISTIAVPRLIIAFITSGVMFQPKSLCYIWRLILGLLRGEGYPKVDLKQYPAHFHINVLKEYRDSGIGSQLLSTYIDYLKQKGVKGVHLHTVSYNKATLAFYKKFGFYEMGRHRTHLYDNILSEPLYFLTLAKYI